MSDSPLNVKPGDPMPAFALQAHYPDGSSRQWRLADMRGRPVVLFWYPQADTPGCTVESKAFRDAMGSFKEFGAEVVGASSDTVEAQGHFCDKFALNMPLLSDAGGSLRALLGNPDGAQPVSRITYVIDGGGIVRAVLGVPRIAPDEHASGALEAVRQLA